MKFDGMISTVSYVVVTIGMANAGSSFEMGMIFLVA